jgi:hypothetical protein
MSTPATTVAAAAAKMTIRGTMLAARNAGTRAWDAAAMRLRRSLLGA